MDGWTDVRTDFPCILQDIVPFGAAAQKGGVGLSESKNKKYATAGAYSEAYSIDYRLLLIDTIVKVINKTKPSMKRIYHSKERQSP